VKVTPVARRLAAQLAVNLENITGTGPNGRIVAKDAESAPRARAPTSTVAATAAPVTALTAAQVIAMFAGTAFEEVPLSGMRRTIARRLSQAQQTIPHFYLDADVAVDRLTAERARINAQAAGQFKLSFSDLVIKALAVALQTVPDANAVWAEDRILRFRSSDIGVAVAVEGGMLTPVIRGAESKTLTAISREMSLLAQRARIHALTPREYQGGVMTISNLGMYGVRSFAAIVNPPQAAILAVGAVERRPAEAPDGSVRFGGRMSLTLSCDHRVMDGALGARLLIAVKDLLETPLTLFS
jgi:pyruvate dehydrogenase E2 component (dihydrolipoamide acetyltransferase)